MIYRVFKIEELNDDLQYTWQLPVLDSDGNETGSYNYYYNRDTLVYCDSGIVSSWSIDEDYMVNNNSTIGIARSTEATPGMIVVLIKDSGAYDMGVITAVDNEKLQITYKPMTYLLDVDILNPMRANDNTTISTDGEEAVITDDDGNTVSTIVYKYNAVEDTARILASIFCGKNTDRYLRLPLVITTSGTANALWNYTDDTLNISDWIKDLFDNLNIVLQFGLTFETSRAYITILISYVTSNGYIIKNNISGMEITHTDDQSAKATVCHVLNKDTKACLATYYLLSSNEVTTDADNARRVQPYKVTTEDVDTSEAEDDNGETDEVVLEDLEKTAAESALLYSDFNHYISLNISRDSKMYPDGMPMGAAVTIVPEILDMTQDDDLFTDKSQYEDYIWNSIYTGRKEKSTSTQVTLVFGKIRINYTDLIQMKYAKKARA